MRHSLSLFALKSLPGGRNRFEIQQQQILIGASSSVMMGNRRFGFFKSCFRELHQTNIVFFAESNPAFKKYTRCEFNGILLHSEAWKMATSKSSNTVLLQQRVVDENDEASYEEQIGEIEYFGYFKEIKPPLIFARIRYWNSADTTSKGIYKQLLGQPKSVFVDLACIIGPVIKLPFRSEIWIAPTKKISFTNDPENFVQQIDE